MDSFLSSELLGMVLFGITGLGVASLIGLLFFHAGQDIKSWLDRRATGDHPAAGPSVPRQPIR